MLYWYSRFRFTGTFFFFGGVRILLVPGQLRQDQNLTVYFRAAVGLRTPQKTNVPSTPAEREAFAQGHSDPPC